MDYMYKIYSSEIITLHYIIYTHMIQMYPIYTLLGCSSMVLFRLLIKYHIKGLQLYTCSS